MASLSTWSWPPKAATARSHLILSTSSSSSSSSSSSPLIRTRVRTFPGFSLCHSRHHPPPSVAANKKWRRVTSRLGRPPCGPSPDDPRAMAPWKRFLSASKKVRSVVLLNVITLIYASSIPVVKEVELITDPAVFTMVRFTVTAIPFIPSIFKACKDRQTRFAGIELGIWVSLGYLAQALGLLTSSAGHASFISAFTVIIVPLIDGIFGARIPALTWYGALTSLVGVAMLEYSGSPCVGDVLNLLSAVFFAIHMLRTEHISRSINREKFLALLGYEVSVVALLSMTWVFVRAVFGDVQHLSLESWAWTTFWNWIISFPWIPALYTGIFSTGLCLWAELTAMRDVSATETAIIYGLEPLWGAAFAWFLLGERWGITGWIGATLVICGSLTVQILGSPPKKSREDEGGSQYKQMNALDGQSNFSFHCECKLWGGCS